jgi:LPXTG-motif cell wall-anchored protein
MRRLRRLVIAALTGTAGLSLSILFATNPAYAQDEAPSLSIFKDCGGLSGTLDLSLSLTRDDEQFGTAGTVQVECGKSTPVSVIPQFEGSISFLVGDTITITEPAGQLLALLPAPSKTVEVAVGVNAVTIVDPPAVSIKKTCAAGVTGTATFLVSNDSEEASITVRVPCGATIAVPIPNGWDSGEDLVIHETTPPTNGIAGADVTVRIPGSSGEPQLAEFTNAAAATATPAPTVVALPQTGDGGSGTSLLLIGGALGGALLMLLGFGLWRRRAA